MPKVWNVSDPAMPSDAIYVGRGGRGAGGRWYVRHPLGNPYLIGRDGSREEVVAKFEVELREMITKEPGMLEPMRGYDLACHCAPLPCHADVLLRFANGEAS